MDAEFRHSRAGSGSGIRVGVLWQIALDTIKRANRELYESISRKMLNYLCWCGIPEAEPLLRSYHPARLRFEKDEYAGEWNTPREGHGLGFSTFLGTRVFSVAADHFDSDHIMHLIRSWVQEDKQSFLVQLVSSNLHTSTVADLIRRYHDLSQEPGFVPITRTRGVLIALIRRFLSEDRRYVDIAKDLVSINDFHYLLERAIHSAESHGRLGGKSAGLYLANQMQVRLEYPCISQAFKSVAFPADITRGLSYALDDFGVHPIIVRSSSLLEDSVGAAFCGKYKSLFLANQGSKRRRLEALTDAIAEVYASTFGPDPIEYRADRGLLDYNEEMGIMIQEVVGRRIGKYFFPAFAGVAFSSNEFRWSPRVRREDGLLRMVPGLGTRAVDRLSDDYPVLVSPGQPNLKVNASPEDTWRYSPRYIDVLNLENESLESIRIDAFLTDVGNEYPEMEKIFSVYRDDQIREIRMTGIDAANEAPVATFNNLIARTPFITQIQTVLRTLEETLHYPVDIEFASDGLTLHLLQCRPQSHSRQRQAA
ncbi:MAG: pyruvate, phosphate dikinase, partial [candidate division Zixibacteria bacterium]|nr:pyruvate, phosphate dikinase [candidate division Zixibacteria bacterium]